MDQDNLNQQPVDETQQAGQADGQVGQTEPTTDVAPGSDQDLTGGAPGSDGVAGDGDEQASQDEV